MGFSSGVPGLWHNRDIEMLSAGTAFILYLAIAAAGVALLDGKFRTILLIFVGGLALKTWVARLRQKAEVMGETEGTRETSAGASGGETP